MDAGEFADHDSDSDDSYQVPIGRFYIDSAYFTEDLHGLRGLFAGVQEKNIWADDMDHLQSLCESHRVCRYADNLENMQPRQLFDVIWFWQLVDTWWRLYFKIIAHVAKETFPTRDDIMTFIEQRHGQIGYQSTYKADMNDITRYRHLWQEYNSHNPPKVNHHRWHHVVDFWMSAFRQFLGERADHKPIEPGKPDLKDMLRRIDLAQLILFQLHRASLQLMGHRLREMTDFQWNAMFDHDDDHGDLTIYESLLYQDKCFPMKNLPPRRLFQHDSDYYVPTILATDVRRLASHVPEWTQWKPSDRHRVFQHDPSPSMPISQPQRRGREILGLETDWPAHRRNLLEHPKIWKFVIGYHACSIYHECVPDTIMTNFPPLAQQARHFYESENFRFVREVSRASRSFVFYELMMFRAVPELELVYTFISDSVNPELPITFEERKRITLVTPTYKLLPKDTIRCVVTMVLNTNDPWPAMCTDNGVKQEYVYRDLTFQDPPGVSRDFVEKRQRLLRPWPAQPAA